MRVFSRTSVLAFLVVFAVSMHAQWQSSAGNTTTSDKVGIGTTAPAAELHVVSQTATINLRGLVVDHYTNDANAALMTGRKARGTLAAPLAVQNGDSILNPFPMAYDGTQFLNPSRIRFQIDGAVGAGSVPMAFQIFTGTNASGGTERVRVTSAGNVGIGTSAPAQRLHIVGNVRVDGELTGTNIKAQYQDLAEWVPSNADLEPGTVVILDRVVGNGVMASSGAYDTMVAGVVSARPGIILGEEGASKEKIATTGRVRVKVDASAEPIQIGDLLVTSSRTGRAMKSSPIDVAGIAMHRPGTIIGKALEPLRSGEGEILVLLSMQ
ncbi:MAG: hypothetical protein QOH21_1537 [Acidobacteriota bacterium]|nr:hypothetical protein [Acidobacteriota bacterium]